MHDTTQAPVVDGTQLTDQPVNLFNAGAFNPVCVCVCVRDSVRQVPTIIGDVSDEGRMFVFSALNSSSTLECDAFIDAVFKTDASKVCGVGCGWHIMCAGLCAVPG